MPSRCLTPRTCLLRLPSGCRTLSLVAILAFLAPADFLDAGEPKQESDGTRPPRIYLDEFRPTSVLKTDEHLVDHARFPCVNVHLHPGRLTESELDLLVRVMDEANIAVAVSLDGGRGEPFAQSYYHLMHRHTDRFAVFLRLDYIGQGDPDDPSTWDVHKPDYGQRMADRITEAHRQGATGLKVWKDLGLGLKNPDGSLIPPDDSRFDPVWARCGELGIPVLWHCADPVAFFQPLDPHNERWEELARHPDWSFYGDEFPHRDELLAARNRVVKRHPDTTFIAAHMSDLPEDLAQLGELLDQHPNLYVEISARVAELGRQPYTAREFFIEYADRILFGTDDVPPPRELVPHFRFLETRDEYFDYRGRDVPPQGRWYIYGIDLPDDVLEKIYNGNASRLIPGVAAKVEAYVARRRQDDAE